MPFQPSPFPGMDPYMERRWGSVRAALVVYAADGLAAALPDDMAARIAVDEYADPDPRCLGPMRDKAVHTVEFPGDRPITSIEFVNPWNRSDPLCRSRYVGRRLRASAGGENLVEVDLVRAGRPILPAEDVVRRDDAGDAYGIRVTRNDGRVDRFVIPLAERLPAIPVPLRPGEPDVTIDLQSLVDAVYRNGRYDRIDYAQPCVPPLTGADADWADALLRAAGRRG